MCIRDRAGTYHFYTEDSRFATIWQKPDMLIAAGCVNAVEPNFSVYDQVPRAVALLSPIHLSHAPTPAQNSSHVFCLKQNKTYVLTQSTVPQRSL